MSSLQYVVYIPDGIMDFSCTLEIPEDAKVVDLWNAARKTFPMLSQCRIIIFKCDDLLIEPVDTLYERASERIRNGHVARMMPSQSLQQHFPSGTMMLENKKVVHVIIAPSYYLDFSCGFPVQEPIDLIPVLPDQWDFASSGWTRESDRWTAFLNFWRQQSFEETFNRDVIPFAWSEEGMAHEYHRLRIPFYTRRELLVPESFRELFRRVWNVGMNFPESGVLLSGQSGTGKTAWLWFMLVCLITKGETVAFVMCDIIHLFHGDRVYLSVVSVPTFPEVDNVWCLLDHYGNHRSPTSLVRSRSGLFPVLACSPTWKSYDGWIGGRPVLVFGMPLWSASDIYNGFKLTESYSRLREALLYAFDCRKSELLPECRETLRAVLTESWDVAQNSRFSQDKQLWAENTIQGLIGHIVDLYGGIPRDVYQCVQNPEKMARLISDELRLATIGEIARRLRTSYIGNATGSELFIHSVEPDRTGANDDTFVPKFRSDAIGRRVIERVGYILPEHQNQGQISVYESSPRSSLLAEWIFASVVHAAFSVSPYLLGSLHPMLQDNSAKPRVVFRMQGEAHRLGSSLPFRYRKIVSVDVNNGNIVWPYELGYTFALEDCLFTLRQRENALFDAFLVNFEEGSSEPVVWIIRSATGPSREDEGGDYSLIRCIKEVAEARAEERAGGVEAKRSTVGQKRKRTGFSIGRWFKRRTKLVYILARPMPEEEHSWEMPPGWAPPVDGKIFCQFIDFSQL